MVYFNKINGDKQVVQAKKTVPVQTQQGTVKVVPIGQSQEQKSEDPDKLPQGFYIEKSQDTPSTEPTEAPADEVQKAPPAEQSEIPAQDDNNDDEPDTDIHPDARITVDSIALTQADQIDDAIEGAEIKGLNSAIEESGSKLDNAITMIKSNPLSIFEQKFQKGTHGTGIARFELTNYKGEITDVTKFSRTTNTKRIDFSGTYESPKGNTKIMLYASGTTTERHVKADFNSASTSNNDVSPDESTPDISDISDIEKSAGSQYSEPTESREKLNKYSLYAGGKFKIKNDELSTVILHSKGGELENSKTTQIDARYYINQYNVNVDASTIIYNIGSKNSVKTNISCYFNTKDKPVEQQDESSDEPVNDNENENNSLHDDVNQENFENSSIQNQNKKDKKWVKKGGLIVDLGNVDGEAEEGIGYYKSFRRFGDSSSLRILPFIKGSVTPRKDETDSYHVTTGVNLIYNKKFSPDSSLSAVADIKDKVSFCGIDKGNIFTAFGDVKYSYKKFLATLEGKYINVTDSKYAALALRASYKANKNLILFGDASYVSEVNTVKNIKGGSFMIGTNVTF